MRRGFWNHLSLTRKFGLVFAGILLITLVNVGGVQLYINSQQADARTINTAGQQRLLVQQLTTDAYRIDDGENDRRAALSTTADRYDRTLTAFLEGNESMGVGPAPEPVRSEARALEAEWEPFYANLTVLATAPQSSDEFRRAFDYVSANQRDVLAATDDVVTAFERTSSQKVTRLQSFLVSVFVLEIVVLAAGWRLVTRNIAAPIRRLADDTRRISEGDLDHDVRRFDADDEIGEVSRAVRAMKDQLVTSLLELRIFEQAVEHAGRAIYITDADGTIEYVNPAFVRITGYGPSEVIGETPSVLSSGEHDDPLYEELWETILSGETWEAELVNRRKSGKRFYASQTIAPIVDENGDAVKFVAVCTDVTEQKYYEQQLTVLQRVLRHNLRNGLNVVMGHAEAVDEPDDSTSPAEAAREIRAECESLAEISDKVGAIRDVIDPETDDRFRFDVAATIECVATDVERSYPRATITTDVSTTAEVSTEADVETALRELVVNAVEHNDASTPKVWVSVTRSADAAFDEVVVRIADNGPGIPADERAVLERGTETPLLHGSGLGLWLVNWIVSMSGGKVTLEDREPRGTEIRVHLPVDTPARRPDGGVQFPSRDGDRRRDADR
jgi:PAS domain S-box-containing protein